MVSDVGDLGDLVESGQNGYLVSPIQLETFVPYLESLLGDADTYTQCREAALESTRRYQVGAVAEEWSRIF